MRKAFAAMLLLVAVLGGCSGEGKGDGGGGSDGPRQKTSTFEEGTLELTAVGRGQESTKPKEGTLGEETDEKGDVQLRLEGDAKTRFSGICTVGGKENVISGQVPKRFVFDLGNDTLDCRIQKQDAAKGSLKSILVVGESTRSVQQTNTRGGTIQISFSKD